MIRPLEVPAGDSDATCRIDTLDELEYFRNGGILPYMLRQFAA
jgi:aconitase A